ncbi:putative serine/threonine-protein kinase PBL16 [Capsicum galapagoense]
MIGNLRQYCMLDGGEFGNIYKGYITQDLRKGFQPITVVVKIHDGNNSYQGHREWLLLHPNLVKLISYCCEADHQVLICEYMAQERIGTKRVQTLRIDTIDKSSSRWRATDILVLNTAHWWNHRKTKAGHLTPKSDVYYFDRILLELLTGRKSLDKSRSSQQQNLHKTAMPLPVD